MQTVSKQLFKGYKSINQLPISLYVHWPYCTKICPYCNFNKYKDSPNVDHEKMSKSLSNELKAFGKNYYNSDNNGIGSGNNVRPINSIYFGGGTPSLAKVSTFVETIETMRNVFPEMRIEDIEITLEVNPDQKDLHSLLKDFKQYVGVNRVSLGIQSLVDRDLEYLGRTHTVAQAVESLKISQELFENVSFDLIYGRNQLQTPEEWRKELRDALFLSHGQGHLSCYSLTFEEGTNFHKRLSLKSNNSKKIIQPDHDRGSDLYDITIEETSKHGFNQYEVSSFASSNLFKSKHNQNYWRSGDYIGIGPGSSSRVTNSITGNRYSLKNISHPKDWMKIHMMTNNNDNGDQLIRNAFDNSINDGTISLSINEIAEEILLMGLRTIEGVSIDTFKFLTNGLSITQFLIMDKVELFKQQGLLLLDENYLKLTPKGIMLLDSIIYKILPNK